MRILGIDPGLATGLAIWDTDYCRIVDMAQADNGIDGFTDVFNYMRLSMSPKDKTVVERFTLRAGNKFLADLSGVEIIGWLKGEGYVDALTPTTQHMPYNKLGNGDPKADSWITHLMKAQKFPIGAGHTRMALSVATYYACTKLKHAGTLELHNNRMRKINA